MNYYYHLGKKHIITFSLRKNFGYGDVSSSLRYDSFSEPIAKTASFGINVAPNDYLKLGFIYDYDIEQQLSTNTRYSLNYIPGNRCWLLNLAYEISLIEKRVSINFLVNFNKNQFKSIE